MGNAERLVRAFVSKQEDQSLDAHGSLPSIPVSPWKVNGIPGTSWPSRHTSHMDELWAQLRDPFSMNKEED